MLELSQADIDAMARRRVQVLGAPQYTQMAVIEHVYRGMELEPIHQFAYEGQMMADLYARERMTTQGAA